MAIVALSVFIVAYALIATERIHKVKVALGGAAVVLALGIVDSHDVFYSRETGIDWDVIFLLLGMMIIVGVLRRTGVFEYVAIWAAKRAKGSPFRVMVLLVLLTVGGVTEQVVVSGQATMVESRSATQSNLIDDQRVQDLPMNGRNVVALAGTYADWYKEVRRIFQPFAGPRPLRFVR